MLEKVKDAVLVDHEELDETTYDLQRAFEMFLQTDCFNKEDIMEEVRLFVAQNLL